MTPPTPPETQRIIDIDEVANRAFTATKCEATRSSLNLLRHTPGRPNLVTTDPVTGIRTTTASVARNLNFLTRHVISLLEALNIVRVLLGTPRIHPHRMRGVENTFQCACVRANDDPRPRKRARVAFMDELLILTVAPHFY